MDSGENDGDFVLLDRRQRKVINVMRDNQLAMVFTPGTVPPQTRQLETPARHPEGRARHPAFQSRSERCGVQ